jgi:hypothetical protein
MSKIRQLAAAEAFHRVPETCPEIHTEGTNAAFKFCKWLDGRFGSRLTEEERDEIERHNGDCVADVLEGAKEHGTRPLRKALIDEIEAGMRGGMTQGRIDRIEAGEDPESTLEPRISSSPSEKTALPAAV